MKLVFENVSAAYGGKTVLEKVSFHVPAGSITALIGQNGAGKSTLIRCLMGDKPDYEGCIRAEDADVRKMDRPRRVRTLACLPQILPDPHVTVRQLVSFGRTPYTPLSGRLSEADREAVEQAMEAVGVGDLGDTMVNTLSGGQRKKAFLAMTLAQDTPVVVLDEPTAHLDTRSRFALLELLDRLRKQTGKTFLVVAHELPELLRYADRLAVLCEGRLVFNGDPGACLAQGIPEAYFDLRITGNRQEGFAVNPLQEK